MSSTRPGGMREALQEKCALGVVVIGDQICLCHLLLNPSLFVIALPKHHDDQSCKDRILQPHRRKGQYKQEDRDEDQEWQVLYSHVRAFNRTLTGDTITTRQQVLINAHSNWSRGHRRVLDLILKVFIPAGYLDFASPGKHTQASNKRRTLSITWQTTFGLIFLEENAVSLTKSSL